MGFLIKSKSGFSKSHFTPLHVKKNRFFALIHTIPIKLLDIIDFFSYTSQNFLKVLYEKYTIRRNITSFCTMF